jgi:hypothetical protein
VIESLRIQWEDARARIEREDDAVRQTQLLELVDAVTGGLRRELGSIFSLRELEEQYVEAEIWVVDLVRDQTPRERARVGPRDATLVLDAAFDLYARGAHDYEP